MGIRRRPSITLDEQRHNGLQTSQFIWTGPPYRLYRGKYYTRNQLFFEFGVLPDEAEDPEGRPCWHIEIQSGTEEEMEHTRRVDNGDVQENAWLTAMAPQSSQEQQQRSQVQGYREEGEASSTEAELYTTTPFNETPAADSVSEVVSNSLSELDLSGEEALKSSAHLEVGSTSGVGVGIERAISQEGGSGQRRAQVELAFSAYKRKTSHRHRGKRRLHAAIPLQPSTTSSKPSQQSDTPAGSHYSNGKDGSDEAKPSVIHKKPGCSDEVGAAPPLENVQRCTEVGLYSSQKTDVDVTETPLGPENESHHMTSHQENTLRTEQVPNDITSESGKGQELRTHRPFMWTDLFRSTPWKHRPMPLPSAWSEGLPIQLDHTSESLLLESNPVEVYPMAQDNSVRDPLATSEPNGASRHQQESRSLQRKAQGIAADTENHPKSVSPGRDKHSVLGSMTNSVSRQMSPFTQLDAKGGKQGVSKSETDQLSLQSKANQQLSRRYSASERYAKITVSEDLVPTAMGLPVAGSKPGRTLSERFERTYASVAGGRGFLSPLNSCSTAHSHNSSYSSSVSGYVTAPQTPCLPVGVVQSPQSTTEEYYSADESLEEGRISNQLNPSTNEEMSTPKYFTSSSAPKSSNLEYNQDPTLTPSDILSSEARINSTSLSNDLQHGLNMHTPPLSDSSHRNTPVLTQAEDLEVESPLNNDGARSGQTLNTGRINQGSCEGSMEKKHDRSGVIATKEISGPKAVDEHRSRAGNTLSKVDTVDASMSLLREGLQGGPNDLSRSSSNETLHAVRDHFSASVNVKTNLEKCKIASHTPRPNSSPAPTAGSSKTPQTRSWSEELEVSDSLNQAYWTHQSGRFHRKDNSYSKVRSSAQDVRSDISYEPFTPVYRVCTSPESSLHDLETVRVNRIQPRSAALPWSYWDSETLPRRVTRSPGGSSSIDSPSQAHYLVSPKTEHHWSFPEVNLPQRVYMTRSMIQTLQGHTSVLWSTTGQLGFYHTVYPVATPVFPQAELSPLASKQRFPEAQQPIWISRQWHSAHSTTRSPTEGMRPLFTGSGIPVEQSRLNMWPGSLPHQQQFYVESQCTSRFSTDRQLRRSTMDTSARPKHAREQSVVHGLAQFAFGNNSESAAWADQVNSKDDNAPQPKPRAKAPPPRRQSKRKTESRQSMRQVIPCKNIVIIDAADINGMLCPSCDP